MNEATEEVRGPADAFVDVAARMVVEDVAADEAAGEGRASRGRRRGHGHARAAKIAGSAALAVQDSQDGSRRGRGCGGMCWKRGRGGEDERVPPPTTRSRDDRRDLRRALPLRGRGRAGRPWRTSPRTMQRGQGAGAAVRGKVGDDRGRTFPKWHTLGPTGLSTHNIWHANKVHRTLP